MVGCPYSAGICSRPSLPDAAARNPVAQPNTTAPNAAAVPRGCRLSGYECEAIKEAAIAAGLPVIDSRAVAFDAVAALAIGGPIGRCRRAGQSRSVAQPQLRPADPRCPGIPGRRRGGVQRLAQAAQARGRSDSWARTALRSPPFGDAYEGLELLRNFLDAAPIGCVPGATTPSLPSLTGRACSCTCPDEESA